MWQDESEATNACSGSTPGAGGTVRGMLAGAAFPGTLMPPSKRQVCWRL